MHAPLGIRTGTGLLCLLGGLGALNSGCINCSERIEQTSGWIEVKRDEACPPVSDSLYLSYSGDDLLSVDGPGKQAVLQPARQRCCYDGDFTFRGSETPSLCRYVEGAEVPDEGDVSLCPQTDPADAPNHWWYANDGLGGSRDVSATRIGEPRLESVTPRTWQCVYPITVRRTADVCG